MRRLAFIASIVTAAGLTTALAISPPEAGQPKMDPAQEAQMAAYMKAGTPGPEHAWLAKGAGKWEGTSKMWMDPKSPAMESTCKTEIKMLMDGRYMSIDTAGEMPGMGMFMGHGIVGFDNVSRKFQMTWIDSMSTQIMNGTGELSADQKTMTWTMWMNDPVSKQPTKFREVDRYLSDNEFTLEMYGPDSGGTEYKMMEIRYTRAK